jgi:hypothetical protein
MTREDLELYRELHVQTIINGTENEDSQSTWRLVARVGAEGRVTLATGAAFWSNTDNGWRWSNPDESDYEVALAKGNSEAQVRGGLRYEVHHQQDGWYWLWTDGQNQHHSKWGYSSANVAIGMAEHDYKVWESKT